MSLFPFGQSLVSSGLEYVRIWQHAQTVLVTGPRMSCPSRYDGMSVSTPSTPWNLWCSRWYPRNVTANEPLDEVMITWTMLYIPMKVKI